MIQFSIFVLMVGDTGLHHSQYFHSVALDKDTIPQSLLDIERKTRSNPLKWNGQFSPQLIEILLKHYSEASTTIFDPFLGSGTVLLEAGLLKRKAFGTEINPAAYLLAKTYSLITMSSLDRKRYLTSVSQLLENRFGLKLFNGYSSNGFNCAESIKARLSDTLREASNEIEALLLKVLIVLLDFHKQGLTDDKVFRVWSRIREHILALPYSEIVIDVFHADARSTPMNANSIDMVLTSPPYINVFNYHQQYRASLEHLNYDLLTVAKSEIGSNRKHRGNRFLTVIQYCLDMAQVFAELLRICHKDSHMIFVVGRESTIRGTTFFNGEIVTEVAHQVFNLKLCNRQERCFRNRFGQNIYEDILHFSLGDVTDGNLLYEEKAQQVADLTLRNAYHYASDEVRSDILAALQKLEDVNPSPLIDTAQIKDYV